MENNNGTNGNLSTVNKGGEHAPANRETGLAGLLFGDTGQEREEQSPEAGGAFDAGGAEKPADDSADDGTHPEGDTGAAEGEVDPEITATPDVWEFDGQEYKSEQIAEALKDHDLYQRFNQSIAPLVEQVKRHQEFATDMKVAATTECEKVIAELQRSLDSNTLDAREYQQAHRALVQAKERQKMLDNAVAREKEQRQQLLTTARQQNARTVATNLLRSGWSPEQIQAVEAVAQTAFTSSEVYADSLSPALMNLVRDAMAHRKMQAAAESRLRDQGKKAVKVKAAAPVKPVEKKQPKDLGSLMFKG